MVQNRIGGANLHLLSMLSPTFYYYSCWGSDKVPPHHSLFTILFTVYITKDPFFNPHM